MKSETSPTPLLELTVGLPRSGKSTWARGEGCPVVCPDEIRLALHGQAFIASAEGFVWAIARIMVAALFRAGHKRVILDATNITYARRKEWNSPDWHVGLQPFEAPKEICIARAHEGGREDLVPII